MERCLNDIFEVKKSILVKNLGVPLTLKMSTSQRLGTYALVSADSVRQLLSLIV